MQTYSYFFSLANFKNILLILVFVVSTPFSNNFIHADDVLFSWSKSLMGNTSSE